MLSSNDVTLNILTSNLTKLYSHQNIEIVPFLQCRRLATLCVMWHSKDMKAEAGSGFTFVKAEANWEAFDFLRRRKWKQFLIK